MNFESLFSAAEPRLGPEGRLGAAFGLLDGALEGRWRDAETFPAASIIKVPIMVEVLRLCQAGRADLDGEMLPLQDRDRVGGAGVLQEMHSGMLLSLRDLVNLTIVVSDNIASNMLIDRVGMPELNAALRRDGLAHSVLGRKFMIEPDSPVNKNFTTPADMRHCLHLLWHGRLLDEAHTRIAVDIISRQQYREKIPLLLPESLKVGNKTGEISGVRHDVALVLHPRHPYVLCLLTHQVSDVLLADRVIAELSRNVYDYVETL